MTIAALLADLDERGITLLGDGENLHYRGPKGSMDESLRARITSAKPALIAHLSKKPSATSPVSKQFSIGGRRPLSAPMIPDGWTPVDPFQKIVEPHKSYLLDRLKIAKSYERADGVHLWTDDGQQVLDCLSQYGALPFGHNPQRIWDALDACRVRQEPAFSANSIADAAGKLAERLVALWPEAGFAGVTFTNSGAESVEVALKLARAATDRRAILTTSRGFHGLTLGALSAAGSPVYRDAFHVPLAGDCIPYGDIDALERAFAARRNSFAALILEPIQGEGGIIEPPAGYLTAARELCDASGTLLILDEVQTGLGRTGKLFAAQHENVVADIVTLAKALGGGLMPVGAVLYRETARSTAFGLRHSSTFAGGAMACRAGLATLDWLTEDNGALLDHVKRTGVTLRERLEEIAARHPDIVDSITGRGMMQGVRLRFTDLWKVPGLVGLLHDQNLMIHVAVSHLLNAGGIRLAPSFSAGDVLRIQPPLTVTETDLLPLYDALDATLSAISEGRSSELLRHFIDETRPSSSTQPGPGKDVMPRPSPEPQTKPADTGRFAFVVHPLETADFLRLDPDLGGIPADRMADLVVQLADYVDPLPVEALNITSTTGARAYGELIMVPYTPDDLMRMPVKKAVDEIGLAVTVAQQRGARVVGLGGFSSIVTQGGVALARPDRPALTSGNAFTSIAAAQAIRTALYAAPRPVGSTRATVVGAAGMIGRAVSALLSEFAGELVLMGNPNRQQGIRTRGLAVAGGMVDAIKGLARHRAPASGSLAERVIELSDQSPEKVVHTLEKEGRLMIGTDLASALEGADAVVLATNSTERFVRAQHLKRDAVVCDVSRPFNLHPDVSTERPDVTLIEGGIVQPARSLPHISLAGPARDRIYACAAETMLWALEQDYDHVAPSSCMEVDTLLLLEELGKRHGFRVVNATDHA